MYWPSFSLDEQRELARLYTVHDHWYSRYRQSGVHGPVSLRKHMNLFALQILQGARGMEYLHGRDIVHGDLRCVSRLVRVSTILGG
jgi:hypothetical protein